MCHGAHRRCSAITRDSRPSTPIAIGWILDDVMTMNVHWKKFPNAAPSSCLMKRILPNEMILPPRAIESDDSAASPRLHCAVCGSPGPFQSKWEILLSCPLCGLIFADQSMTEADIRRLYGKDYFTGSEYADYLGDKNALQRSFRLKLRRMTELAPQTRRVFEVGAAYGFFLELAQELWEAAGIDISEDAVAYGQDTLRLNVRQGDFLEAKIPPHHYDVFCMWDTIEHLMRPDAYIARIAELIAPGGSLFISTGDIASPVARRQGRRWRLIHPPTHLFYFSRSTLSCLLERHGFVVKEIQSIGTHRSLRQTVYSLMVQNHPSLRTPYNWFAGTPLAAMSYCLDIGDIIMVAAQAPGHLPRSV